MLGLFAQWKGRNAENIWFSLYSSMIKKLQADVCSTENSLQKYANSDESPVVCEDTLEGVVVVIVYWVMFVQTCLL